MLRHRRTGELIDACRRDRFSFYDWLDVPALLTKSPDFVTRRTLELHPQLRSMRVTLSHLYEAGALNDDPLTQPLCFSLTAEVLKWDKTARKFSKLLEDESLRSHLCAAIGDDPTGPACQVRLSRI